MSYYNPTKKEQGAAKIIMKMHKIARDNMRASNVLRNPRYGVLNWSPRKVVLVAEAIGRVIMATQILKDTIESNVPISFSEEHLQSILRCTAKNK